MNKWVAFLIKHSLVILLGLLLGYLMYWRWQVSQTRFFDVDEFSYLHWAANVARGQRPYTDFFMFFTPGFLWLFAPLFSLFPHEPGVFIAARVVSFGIFLGILFFLWLLFSATRGKKWALLPVIFLAFLPMPYDKFLETRPDNLSTLLGFGGLVLQVLAMTKQKDGKSLWFWSGFMYMASLVVFAKTLPFIMVGSTIAFVSFWWGKNESFRVWWKSFLHTPKAKLELFAFIQGLAVPLGIFFVWILTLGDIGQAWYSLTTLPFEANTFGKFTIMEPHLFFFPNGSFYGGSATITKGLILNHTIWIIGIIAGVLRSVTPFITSQGERKHVLVEVLIGGVFLLSVFGYVQFFPLKHSQYLIPIAIFIAYYCADICAQMLDGIIKRAGTITAFAVILACSYILSIATIEVNQVKLSWSNVAQLQQIQILADSIPPEATILDLEGRMVFWKDAYYICCVPFGSFVQFLSRPPGSLTAVLESKKIPYIFQGDSNRLALLSSEEQSYIRGNYTPVKGWGQGLWERKEP